MCVKAVWGESSEEGSHAVLCVENGNSLSLLRTSYQGAVQSHPHKLVWAYTIKCK